MKAWLIAGGVLLGVMVAVGVGHRWILLEYAELFHADDATPGADAIVVLSSPSLNRLEKAFDLQRAGFSDVLLLTETPKPRPLFEDLYVDKMTWVLRVAERAQHHVTPIVIPSLKDGAVSTWDEAYDALAYSRQQRFKRIIIVTNAFHTRRAAYAFQQVFEGSGIEVEVAAAENPIYISESWWKSDYGLQAYITEFFKFGFYLFHEGNVAFIQNDA